MKVDENRNYKNRIDIINPIFQEGESPSQGCCTGYSFCQSTRSIIYRLGLSPPSGLCLKVTFSVKPSLPILLKIGSLFFFYFSSLGAAYPIPVSFIALITNWYVMSFNFILFPPLENKYCEGSDFVLFTAIVSGPRIVSGTELMLSTYMERRKEGSRGGRKGRQDG